MNYHMLNALDFEDLDQLKLLVGIIDDLEENVGIRTAKFMRPDVRHTAKNVPDIIAKVRALTSDYEDSSDPNNYFRSLAGLDRHMKELRMVRSEILELVRIHGKGIPRHWYKVQNTEDGKVVYYFDGRLNDGFATTMKVYWEYIVDGDSTPTMNGVEDLPMSAAETEAVRKVFERLADNHFVEHFDEGSE